MAFVKFSRGLISQYDSLSQKDKDTLYLVYDSTSSTKGKLYLGDKLISSADISSIKLSDISDISMPESLTDGMLLQYNQSTVPGESGRWEARPIADVLSDYEGSGGSSNIPVVDNLNNIKNPSKNDIAIQGTELFIYDGNQWQPLTVSDLENRVVDLETKVGVEANTESGQVATGLYKKLEDLHSDLQTEIMNSIANAQHLRYQIVNEISEIKLSDEDATANVVFLVPKSSEGTHSDDGYDEYFVTHGALEKIGSWDADLTGYVQDNDNRLLTNQQKQKLDSIGYDSESNQAIISTSQVTNLNQFVQENSYIRDVEAGVFSVDENGKLGLVSVPSDALTNYVSTPVFNSTVGDITKITGYETGHTLVDEINVIKASVIWQELTQS